MLVAAVLLPILGSLVVSLAVAVVAYRLSRRQSRIQLREQVRREAAADLGAALHDARMVVRSSRFVPVTAASVASAMKNWGAACERQDHRLPHTWGHVRRSVLAALGERFGAVVLADIDPTAARLKLAELDIEWQENAECYLSYVLDRLGRWGDGELHDSDSLMNFDAWLREREWQETLRLARFPRLMSILGRHPSTPW